MCAKEKHAQFIKDVILRYYPVNENALSNLYAIAKDKQLLKNEVLLPVGQVARHVYILYSGVMISYFLDKEGNTYNKNIFLEGNFVGSTVSYLTNSPSRFALKAIEDCEIISFSYEHFRSLINSHDDLRNFYIAYLEKNWVIDKEKREIDIVMKDAKTRYLDLLSQHPNIDSRVPLVHIASHLGITPTQMSRIRKSLEK